MWPIDLGPTSGWIKLCHILHWRLLFSWLTFSIKETVNFLHKVLQDCFDENNQHHFAIKDITVVNTKTFIW